MSAQQQGAGLGLSGSPIARTQSELADELAAARKTLKEFGQGLGANFEERKRAFLIACGVEATLLWIGGQSRAPSEWVAEILLKRKDEIDTGAAPLKTATGAVDSERTAAQRPPATQGSMP